MTLAEQQVSVVISFSHEIIIKDKKTGAKGIQQLEDQFGYWDDMAAGASLHMWAIDRAKETGDSLGFGDWTDN